MKLIKKYRYDLTFSCHFHLIQSSFIIISIGFKTETPKSNTKMQPSYGAFVLNVILQHFRDLCLMLAASQQTDLNWITEEEGRVSVRCETVSSSQPAKPDYMNQITATVMDELMNENCLFSNAAHCNQGNGAAQ